MEIKLNPNGWHRRLQTYVFTDPPMFNNFCPYFWITIFCIIFTFIIPLVPSSKLIWSICKGIGWIFDKMANWFEEVICKPMFEAGARKMNSDDVLKAWYFNTYEWMRENWDIQDVMAEIIQWEGDFSKEYYKIQGSKKYKLQIEKFEVWKKVTPKWQEILEAYKVEKKAAKEQYLKDLEENREKLAQETRLAEIKKENVKKRRDSVFSTIVKYTKWLFYVLLVAIATAVVWCFYTLGMHIWHIILDHYYPERFLSQLKFVGISTGIIVILVGILYTIIKIISKISCACFGCSERRSWVVNLINRIGDGIYYTCCAIGKFFSFFWQYIMAVKADYCPGILWQDDCSKNPE